MVCSLNTGISPGPVRNASTTWVGVAYLRCGAECPYDSAPPAPADWWHDAQLARYSTPPMATSTPSVTTFGIGGPSPTDATYATSASMSSWLYAGCLRGGWNGVPCAAGIRPVVR